MDKKKAEKTLKRLGFIRETGGEYSKVVVVDDTGTIERYFYIEAILSENAVLMTMHIDGFMHTSNRTIADADSIEEEMHLLWTDTYSLLEKYMQKLAELRILRD